MIATWERNSFLGIHTQPAKVESGDQYPLDLLNLRIDGNGWLQLRAPVEDSRAIGDETTGVATTDTHIFILSEGGKVKIAKISDFATATLTTALTDTDLTGRLSLVDFGNYVVFTSEGEDQGYIVDIRDDDNYQVFPLGLNPPELTQSSAGAGASSGTTELEPLNYYVFRIASIYLEPRLIDLNNFLNGEIPTPPEDFLLDGMESNLSNPHIYFVGTTADRMLANFTFIDAEGDEHNVSDTNDRANDVVEVENWSIDDTLTTGIILYQSEPIEYRAIITSVDELAFVIGGETINIDLPEYRRITEPLTSFLQTIIHSETLPLFSHIQPLGMIGRRERNLKTIMTAYHLKPRPSPNSVT